MAGGINMSNIKNVAIYLANGFEECEALLVVDLLRRAQINVDMISITGSKKIVSSHSIHVEADIIFEDADFSKYDLLCLPGGMPGSDDLMAHNKLCELIKNHYGAGKYVAAICAAPYILANLGILKDKKATCFPSFKDVLIKGGAKYEDNSVIIDGKIITSCGLGCAILFASSIISELISEEKAREILHQIQWKY